jgi:S-DNA-T family DNA segregation ATPase FtsK/SpoIIIE
MTVNRLLRVFLCHASQDKPVVRELRKRLEAEGWIDPWLDEEKISLGQHWTTVIEDALDASDIVVIFLSKNSVKKEGFVQRELNYAWNLSLEKPQDVIFLIPFRIDECDVPRYLRSRQWGDYFGEQKETTYQNLLRSLKEKYKQKYNLEAEQITNSKINEGNVKPKQVKKEKLYLGSENRITQDLEEKPSDKAGISNGGAEEFTKFETGRSWQLPIMENILEKGRIPETNEGFIQLVEYSAQLIQEILASLGAPVQVVEINRGASVTQYGVEPLFTKTRNGRVKVRASKIESLANDIAVELGVRNVRVQVPVPGRNFVGIEVPNDKITPIALRDIIESKLFQDDTNFLKFALGRDVMGRLLIGALENVSNLLIAGSSHSGKSVFVNSLLACLLLYNTPHELRLVLIDPLRVELGVYNGIPHLVAPVIYDVERAINALRWITREIDKRYKMFAETGVRNIIDYNTQMRVSSVKKLPFLVVVVSEFAELLKLSPHETEQIITRLAQLARITGVYPILVTQRPSVGVLTRLIKANFPTRIAFEVASNSESKIILDQTGAEQLLGRGDMFFQAPTVSVPLRLQGPFISNDEIQILLEFWSSQAQQNDRIPEVANLRENTERTVDPLLPDAIELVRREGRASVSMLQRHMRIGYTRAARIVDIMEDKGIVGAPEGTSRFRKILDYGPITPPTDA